MQLREPSVSFSCISGGPQNSLSLHIVLKLDLGVGRSLVLLERLPERLGSSVHIRSVFRELLNLTGNILTIRVVGQIVGKGVRGIGRYVLGDYLRELVKSSVRVLA